MIPSRITVHCSVTPDSQRFDIARLRHIHMSPPRNWKDVGYHMVIQPDGEVQRGRPLNALGAHVQGENAGNIGICLIGTKRFTQAQFEALRYQLDSLFMTYFKSINPTELYCHYQFKSAQAQGKTCPNIPINNLLRWYWCQDKAAIAPYLYKPHALDMIK